MPRASLTISVRSTGPREFGGHGDSVDRVQVLIAGSCEYEQGLWRRTTELTHYLPDRRCA
jgi:hypothetical protein